MSEKTGIEWTDHTGGPWLLCSKVSAGCKNCYAWVLMLQRLFHIIRRAYRLAGLQDWETREVWGDDAPRVISKGFWTDVVRIDRAHAKARTRGKWFPSMIDWLDDMPAGIMDQDGKWLDKSEVLARFLKTIHDTPNLDWLLLTKRPENWKGRIDHAIPSMECGGTEMAAWLHGEPPENVWIGVSVEDQKRADERIPLLLQIPAKVRFLSVEPLLSPVDLSKWINEIERTSILGADDNGVVLGGQPGSYLEAREIPGRGGNLGAPTSDNEGGAEQKQKGRLSPNPVHGLPNEKAASGGCAQDRVDGLQQETNPRGIRDKSQRWEQTEQCAGESRTGDKAPECHSLHPGSRKEVQIGRGQPPSQTNCGSGGADSRTVETKQHDTTSDSGHISHHAISSKKHQVSTQLERRGVGISWVIVGGESGPNRRDCGVEAICDVVRQCFAAGVPCFVKQDAAFKPGQKGRIPDDIWAMKQFPQPTVELTAKRNG